MAKKKSQPPDVIVEHFPPFGPLWVDQSIRQAIEHCWMMLPKEERSLDKVEKEILRLVQRAFKDMREDAAALGVSDMRR